MPAHGEVLPDGGERRNVEGRLGYTVEANDGGIVALNWLSSRCACYFCPHHIGVDAVIMDRLVIVLGGYTPWTLAQAPSVGFGAAGPGPN